jgi:nitrogen fixation protein
MALNINIPSQVVQVANYAALPATGAVNKIYITIDTELLYRWTGSVYAQVGGSDPEWGDIIGTLSNQTDLQNALDAKVPYTGAIANVDLGEFELKAGQIELDQSPTGTAGVAVTQWNNTIGTSQTTLKGGNVVLKNGIDLVARVVNNTGIQLTKASYQVVKIQGAQGQRLAIGLAQANNDNNSADTLGVVIETIANNQEGFVMTVGQIEDVNTTGSLQSETWNDGDVLYLSPTVAGRITNVKPNGSTGHIVVIGYVEYAHANHGKIYVKVMNGWELDELHNVYINPSTQANNDALIYESSTQLWKNQALKTINSNSLIGSGNIVTTYIRRHETTSTYDYLGFALSGTSENTATWTLTRLTLSSSGVSAVQHATDSWVNRTTATYS